MPKAKKLRFTHVLLVASLILLGACEKAPNAIPASVRADQCTKDWLMSIEIPPCGLDYLNRVGKQQEAIEAQKGRGL